MRPLHARCTECFALLWQKKPAEFMSSCGPAAPSWILTRTPGDQLNSLKLWTIIAGLQSGYCDSKCPPVGNQADQQYRTHINHSYSGFGNLRSKEETWDPTLGHICEAPEDSVGPHLEPSFSNRLVTRIDFCWLSISCYYCHRSVLVSRLSRCALQTNYHIIIIQKRKKTAIRLFWVNI